MATVYGRQKGIGSHSNWSNIPAEVPKFYKIVFNPGVHRLRIPTEFMRRYGGNLRNCVSLKVPSGSLWKVELIHSDGETWLNQGWQQFNEYYSLSFGHFLLFLYDGNSHFDVLIFDTTTLEMEYVRDASHGREARRKRVEKMEGDGSESEDSVVFLKEVLTSKNRKGKNQEEVDETESNVSVEILDNPAARQEKKRKIPEAIDLKSADNNSAEFSDDYPRRKSAWGVQNISSCEKRNSSRFNSSSPNYQSKSSRSCRMKLEDCKEGTTTIVKERCITYQRAKAFMSNGQSQNPFSIVVMQPSYVNHWFLVNITLAFAKENLPGHTNNLILRLLNGKTWPIRYSIGSNYAKLSSGWEKFVKDNALKVGDACVFEVADNSKPIWNVIIFAADHNARKHFV